MPCANATLVTRVGVRPTSGRGPAALPRLRGQYCGHFRERPGLLSTQIFEDATFRPSRDDIDGQSFIDLHVYESRYDRVSDLVQVIYVNNRVQIDSGLRILAVRHRELGRGEA